MTEENVSKKKVEKKVEINRVDPQNIMPVFSNDFLVSHTDNEFFFTFSYYEPPRFETEEDLMKLDKVDAKTVAKIVLTPEFVRTFLHTLTTNMESYDERIEYKNEKNDQSEQ